MLLGLSVNRQHEVFLLCSRDHVANGPDREVDSLELPINGHFDPTCVLPQEIKDFELVQRETVSVAVLDSGGKTICEFLQQNVEFKRFTDVAFEAVFLEAT